MFLTSLYYYYSDSILIMARKIRIQFAGASYHIMSRGDKYGPIFLSNKDRQSFLKTLGDACNRTGWKIHAYVLMTNHYHLLVEIPETNLVEGMRWFQSTYTRRFNIRNNLKQSLDSEQTIHGASFGNNQRGACRKPGHQP